MPMFQVGNDGRDHKPEGFTVWMAGGGVKGGTSYGATDPFVYKAVNPLVMMFMLRYSTYWASIMRDSLTITMVSKTTDRRAPRSERHNKLTISKTPPHSPLDFYHFKAGERHR